MDKNAIENSINVYIKENSNFDTHRDYLGLSKISGCPAAVYDEFKNGSSASEQIYRMSYAGYEQERLIFDMLNKLGYARFPNNYCREVVATFDKRLRGHIDGETYDGNLLEIKSVSNAKFQTIRSNKMALRNHYIQVQLYMLYGGYTEAWIVYRCRDTYEHFVVRIFFDRNQAMAAEYKAKRILEAIDKNERPACECGHCR